MGTLEQEVLGATVLEHCRVTLSLEALAIDLFNHGIVAADHGDHLLVAVPLFTKLAGDCGRGDTASRPTLLPTPMRCRTVRCVDRSFPIFLFGNGLPAAFAHRVFADAALLAQIHIVLTFKVRVFRAIEVRQFHIDWRPVSRGF
ncbi:hypothetical protein [Pseudomonas syringae group genomosp. 3]|uniref:hypothetical protein n=1 Tax=Pseudomonas syringae group genomosp. 3 TaxID=251701 RepID=UPI000F40B9B0|nr:MULTISPECIES: hypothetical protein [Pseudomonas]RMP37197.1 hypothetical protein ALQ23_200186 [Pseudomonas syringae pv. antirrhini]WIN08519.1 hypothetical protein QQF68_06640 [Pseudomonas syringae pv. antirrhini str. 126]